MDRGEIEVSYGGSDDHRRVVAPVERSDELCHQCGNRLGGGTSVDDMAGSLSIYGHGTAPPAARGLGGVVCHHPVMKVAVDSFVVREVRIFRQLKNQGETDARAGGARPGPTPR